MDDEVVVAGYRFAPNKATIVCEHVFGRSSTGKCFYHEINGDLQVTCGAGNHDWEQGRVVALFEAMNWLSSASNLPIVKPGFAAELIDGSWLVEQIDDQQDY